MPETFEPSAPPKPLLFHARRKRALLLALALLSLLALAAALFFKPQLTALLDATDHWMHYLIDLVEQIGPLPFFAAYALLPSIGFSLWFFNFTAGVVYVERLGLIPVLLLAALCIATANALSYWLARRALRPLAAKLVKRLGYTMPVIPPDEHINATLFMRVMPGIPYAVQSYTLGLGNVRFAPYMTISFIIRYGWALATILLGKSYRTVTETGSFKIAALSIALLILLAIATHWLRKYQAKKNTP